MWGLGHGTFGAAGNKLADIFRHARPPEAVLEESESGIGPRVSCSKGGVGGIEKRHALTLRNVDTGGWSIGWRKVSICSSSDLGINCPLDGTHNDSWGKHWHWRIGLFIRVMEMGEGIGSSIVGTSAIGDRELETYEKQGPPGLPEIQPLSLTQVL